MRSFQHQTVECRVSSGGRHVFTGDSTLDTCNWHPSRFTFHASRITHHATLTFRRMTEGTYLELLETRLRNWSSCKTRPVPSATALKGSSAIWTGKPVSSATNRSMPRNNAPPPAMTIPRSTKSADNSGGQRSRVMRTDSKMLDSGSCKASRISSERMVRVFGYTALTLRPLILIYNICSYGQSE